ncbi:response regulator [Desulfobulbus sp.]|uniref:response regulator n=1 Tax=Desulfobulbus sp. TaxID=895 RepID=UPI0027BAB9EC|nr:HD domain-containing phosphohydrolase [Desulfobulbus sp.]
MKKISILIICDNFFHRETIKSILAPIKADLFEMSTVDDSLLIPEGVAPDLIVAILKESPLYQFRICSLLRENSLCMNIPVILMGSADTERNVKNSYSAGVFAYIDLKEAMIKLIPAIEKIFREYSEQSAEIRILVVDDSSSMRLLLEDELSREGYRIATAEDGEQALEIIRSNPPALILSDVYMPKMSGLELCEILHGDPLYSEIPFVVMSSENDAENMRRMMLYGAAAFIVKPFNVEQVMLTLNKIVSYKFLLLRKEKERLAGEQKLMIAGIAGLVKALEARDKYTCGHSERVAFILAGLVEYSGGTSYDVERALVAGRLHDIGKIGIRDNVLLKPGRLSYDEFEHIQQHPFIGASIIKTIPSIADVLPVVISHHERMDGNGYPQGLKGLSIPLWARMTAVADTYDALSSDRSYRKGVSHIKALDIIKNASGSQLCPDCVRLFFDWDCQRELDNNKVGFVDSKSVSVIAAQE